MLRPVRSHFHCVPFRSEDLVLDARIGSVSRNLEESNPNIRKTGRSENVPAWRRCARDGTELSLSMRR